MNEPHEIEGLEEHRVSFLSYILGFVGSIILTLIAYFIVVDSSFKGSTMTWTLSILAGVQAIIQLLFFLHLSEEKKPRSHLHWLLFTLLILLIVLLGSIWIMDQLNYRMMPEMEHKGYHA